MIYTPIYLKYFYYNFALILDEFCWSMINALNKLI